MTIPRLPPAADPLDVNLHVNVNLTPYFTQFYQETKLPDDTPEIFLLRVTKRLAVDHYLLNYVRDALAEQEVLNKEAIDCINSDADLINDEVD